MNHTLHTTDLENFECSSQLAGSFGKGENKSLKVVSKITITGELISSFVVENQRKVVYTTNRLIDAIIKYNEL